MNQTDRIISKFFGIRDRELLIGGVPVSAIVERYGTPIYVYDGNVMDKKFVLLQAALPSNFAISYSVKANPNVTILKHFLAKGCSLEIASGGEYELAIRAGCLPEKILYAGPGKTEEELKMVLTHGIGEIHIESLFEAGRVSGICRNLDVPAKVALRINMSGDAQGGAMRMGGKPSPFGIDEESLDKVLDNLLSIGFIEFRGVHLYMGTQILDFSILVSQYQRALEIAKLVAKRVGGPLHTIDFGGGFGIPYFSNDQELDMENLRKHLVILMDEVKDDALFEGTQFVVEPGRFLVGEAGIYVIRVIDIKVSRGKKFIIVNGGMNHHLAASGNLGQVIKKNFPIAILNKLNEKPTEKVDIVGPLCTPLDNLAREVDLPQASIGDLGGIFQSGAYARTSSPLGFLSHQTPPEIFIYNGEMSLIRRRGTYEDLLKDIP